MKKMLSLSSCNWFDEIGKSDLSESDIYRLRQVVVAHLNRCPFPLLHFTTLQELEKTLPTISIDSEEMIFSTNFEDARFPRIIFEQKKEWKDGFPPLMYLQNEIQIYDVKMIDDKIHPCFIVADTPGQYCWYLSFSKTFIPQNRTIGWRKIKE